MVSKFINTSVLELNETLCIKFGQSVFFDVVTQASFSLTDGCCLHVLKSPESRNVIKVSNGITIAWEILL